MYAYVSMSVCVCKICVCASLFSLFKQIFTLEYGIYDIYYNDVSFNSFNVFVSVQFPDYSSTLAVAAPLTFDSLMSHLSRNVNVSFERKRTLLNNSWTISRSLNGYALFSKTRAKPIQVYIKTSQILIFQRNI